VTRPTAIYTRVSSDRQKETHTISSQLAALVEYADSHGYMVPPEWRFQDEGYSGATLLRPGLEAVRDLAAAGHINEGKLLLKTPKRDLTEESPIRPGVRSTIHQASRWRLSESALASSSGSVSGRRRRPPLGMQRRVSPGRRNR
jgi:hypothetical protein